MRPGLVNDAESGSRRTVVSNAPNSFCDNTVTNSKYTKLTFLPLNLYEQFHRPINLYFLVVTMLQFIPAIAPVSPFSTFGPLALAFSLTAAKEGYDDLQRHRQDNRDNARVYTRLDPTTGELCDVASSLLRVGDVIFLEQGEELPCDVLSLLSDNVVEGICFASTENLDGESESKEKINVLHSQLPASALRAETMIMEDATAFVSRAMLTLHCDEPNAQLRKFNGRLQFSSRDGSEHPVDLSCGIDNLLLASSIVRNSTFVLGLVVYTGNETKVGMNKKFPPIKWARVDRKINKYCLCIFVLQALLTLVFAILGDTATRQLEREAWYLAYRATGVPTIFYALVLPARFYLMLTVMVPISFKVLIDLSKYYISRVIAWDIAMYDPVTDTQAVVNNTSIAEDLGQIQFVMSDKTGTLTENKMEFCYFRALGTTYGLDAPLEQLAQDARESPRLRVAALNLALNNVVQRHPECPSHSTSKTFFDADRVWTSPSPDEVALVAGAERSKFRLLERTRVRASVLIDGEGEALFDILHVLPFSSNRGRMSVLVREVGRAGSLLLVKGADERVLPLCALSGAEGKRIHRAALEDLRRFSSKGLRTLVFAYRDLDDAATERFLNEYRTASTIEGERARVAAVSRVYETVERDVNFLGISAVEDQLQHDVADTIAKLRCAGVRVWMLTGDKRETAKQIGISTGLTTEQDMIFELVSDTDRSTQEQLVQLQEQVRRIVNNCEQPGHFVESPKFALPPLTPTSGGSPSLAVPEAAIFHDIRHEYVSSSKLSDEYVHGVLAANRKRSEPPSSLTNDGNISDRFLTTHRPPGAHGAVGDTDSTALLGSFKGPSTASFANYAAKGACGTPDSATGYCIVVSGYSLELIQQHSPTLEEFRPVLLNAATVICCRVTPDQKALIVRLVKESGAMTLAIGDGGNDVAMIQEAHVGVGITGREGHQAARAADYSFAQFRFLATLMLFHGHSAFQRTAYILQYSFYKSVMIAWTQLLFNMHASFCGVTYWNSFSLTMWNGAYTVPLTLFYALDIHLDAHTLLDVPQLYSLSQRSRYINASTFMWFNARGIIQSTIAFYCTLWVFDSNRVFANGFTFDYTSMFVPTYTGILLLQYCTVLTESHSFTWLQWLSIAVSFLGFIGSFAVYSMLPHLEFQHVYIFCMSTAAYWLGSLLIAAVPFVWHAAAAAAKFWFFPNKLQLQRGLTMAQERHAGIPRMTPWGSMWPTW